MTELMSRACYRRLPAASDADVYDMVKAKKSSVFRGKNKISPVKRRFSEVFVIPMDGISNRYGRFLLARRPWRLTFSPFSCYAFA